MQTQKATGISSLVPNEWHLDAIYDSVWITAYKVALVDKNELSTAHYFDFLEMRLILFWGSLAYLDGSSIKCEFDPDSNLIVKGNVEHKRTPEGAWLIVLQPYNSQDQSNEYEIKTRAGSYASLFIAASSRNIAYERIFDNIANLSSDQTTTSSPVVINPESFDVPMLDDTSINLLKDCGKSINQKSPLEMKRIERSLHWFEKGQRTFGIDSFINHWIAIETIAMKGSTNIRPINELLSRAYDMSLRQATEMFIVGKLFSLRSRIVHHGADMPIQSTISDYIAAIYSDTLLEYLGMPSRRLAKEILERKGVELHKLL